MDEIVVEQFIPSDKPKSFCKMLHKLAIIFAIVGFPMLVLAIVVGIAMEIGAILLFISSYLFYVDFEYEMFEGTITITKIYYASIRRIKKKILKEQVVKVYKTPKNEQYSKKGFYNTNINGLVIYTLVLSNKSKIQLALDEKFEKMVTITYRQQLANN
ncbi:hypothetical protein [Clostridium sp. BJN0001]|uniref:hypothetical protein n=1 Tax=Clostridium sp. BJN0001 TaxID=2930219 RepID=UPI001FD3E2CE|nr:hypothetical protein [Clostridium sp. BJN0001]